MNTLTVPKNSRRVLLPDADRIGVAASVLCAIHCGLAPVLLLTLPAFGKIWAHPASHALVALLIVPLAIFSIRKGYKKHRHRSVAALAMMGVVCVLVGAALPAITSEKSPIIESESPAPETTGGAANSESASDTVCADAACTDTACSEESGAEETAATCVDQCCPSAQISDTGEVSLHIPPAAIVTTLGGFFLIAAHIGNLCSYRKCCESGTCALPA